MVTEKSYNLSELQVDPLEKKEVEPVEPVLKSIYQSSSYRKDLSWPHFNNEQRVQEKQQMKTSILHDCFCSFPNNSKYQLGAPAQTWQQYFIHGHMVDLWRYRATSGERNFKEQNKAPIFLETVLAIEIM